MHGDSSKSALPTKKIIPLKPAEGCPLLKKGVDEASARVQCGFRNAVSGLDRRLKVRSNSAKVLLSERAINRKVEAVLTSLDHINRVPDLFGYLFEEVPEKFDCSDVKFHFVHEALHSHRDGDGNLEDLSALFFESLRSYRLLCENRNAGNENAEPPRYEIHSGEFALRDDHRYIPIVIENSLAHPRVQRCADALIGYVEIPMNEENRQNLKRADVIVKRVMRSVRAHLDRIRNALQIREDYLTKLYNRRGFYELVGDLLEKRPADRHSIITLDLDLFRSVNENYGHGGGDVALRFVADRIRGIASGRPEIVPARFGGEEFVIYVRDRSKEEVLEIAEAIRLSIARGTVVSNDDQFSITASFGAACAMDGDLTWDSVIARADAALYRAKSEGRNRTAVFDSSIDAKERVENPGVGGTYRKNAP